MLARAGVARPERLKTTGWCRILSKTHKFWCSATDHHQPTVVLTTGIRVSSRCNHTLTSDEEGRAALLFGGWGLGGLQHHENNKRAGAVTLAACSMLPHEAVSTNLPLLRGRGEPEHK